MNRLELLERLKIVQPALSNTGLIPIYTHLWFTGTHVLAYDDHIGIQAPLKTEFTGAVPGETFLRLLDAATSEEVTMVVDGTSFNVKAGRSSWKLGILPDTQFPFSMPEIGTDDKDVKSSKDELKAGLQCCMMSVSTDTTTPDMLGITLLPGKDKELLLYSINHESMSRAVVPVEKPPKFERVCLSARFCAQLLRLSDAHDLSRFAIGNGYALARCGDVMLFGRLIESKRPTAFPEIFAQYTPNGILKELYPIPKAMNDILARAVIITDEAADQTSTRVTAKANGDGTSHVTFHSSSTARGEVHEKLTIKKQNNVSVRVRAKTLRAGIGVFEKMAFTENGAVLAKGNLTYLVASTTE